MVYSDQSSAFRTDKNQFFAQLSSVKEIDMSISNAEAQAKDKDHQFLLSNQKSIESEFQHLFNVLRKQKSQNNEEFWLYCYYCASLLEAFYSAYSQQAKATEYASLKKQIINRLKNTHAKPDEEGFIDSVFRKFKNGIVNASTSPAHISQFRDNVAYTNLCRLYWVFCRLTLVQGFNVARDLQLIEKLDILLGTHTDIDKIISTLQAPNPVINIFSVALFLNRLLIEGGLLIKHTFFPTEKEKSSTALERFKHEIYKRHCSMANDFVWGTVNFLTNFNHISKIPSPITGYITATFLIFDIALILHRVNLAKQEYLAKKSQYVKEREDYNNPLLFPHLSTEQRKNHIEMLDLQLMQLEIEFRTKENTLHFAAVAASLLFMGFTASILLTPAAAILAAYFVCHIAVAMYLSTDSFSQFNNKQLLLEQAQLTDKNLPIALKEYEAARNDFIFTMIKNIVIPAVLIVSFALYWPVAIALTAAYVGYELFHSYQQHTDSEDAKQLHFIAEQDAAALPSPAS